MWLLSLKFVSRDGRVALAAAFGIAISVIIVFVEMGFMNGIIDSHLRIVKSVRGDLIVFDARRDNLTKWDEILPIRLQQIAAVPGVSAVLPVYQSGVNFRSGPSAEFHRIILLAFSPEMPPLDLGWSAASLEALRQPGNVLFDRMSQPIYGELFAGQDIWLDSWRMRLAEFISLGPTVINDGLLVTSESTFKSAIADAQPKMAVVRLLPDAETEHVKKAIHALAAGQVVALRPDELAAREDAYLKSVAPLGHLFGAGMIAGIFVGLLICYQSAYETVRRRLKAFSTLKAIGFADRDIFTLVMAQTAVLSAGGYMVGLMLSLALYRLISAHTGLAVDLTFARACAVAAGCLITCSAAGMAAAAKAAYAEPTTVF